MSANSQMQQRSARFQEDLEAEADTNHATFRDASNEGPGMADLGSTTHKASNGAGHSGGNRELDRDIHSRIGSQLRALYNDVVEQPVPDRFEELLRRLEMQSSGDSAQESN